MVPSREAHSGAHAIVGFMTDALQATRAARTGLLLVVDSASTDTSHRTWNRKISEKIKNRSFAPVYYTCIVNANRR